MHPDVEQLFRAVQSHDDRVTALQSTIEGLPDQIGISIEQAIKRAVADRQTWHTAGEALHEVAKERAGGWLFGGLQVLFSRAMWLLLIGIGIYMLGGWTALVGFIKSAFTSG